VRLRHSDGGRSRATRWSSLNVHGSWMPPALRERLYYARIESGVAVRLDCSLADLHPCGCLDDIPSLDMHAFRTSVR